VLNLQVHVGQAGGLKYKDVQDSTDDRCTNW
jgi:hypothetical protein